MSGKRGARRTGRDLSMLGLGAPLVMVVVGGAYYLATLLDTQMQVKDKVRRVGQDRGILLYSYLSYTAQLC
jgi:hypothetical protein